MARRRSLGTALICALVLLSIWATATSAFAAGTVRDIRFLPQNGGMRIVIDVGRSVTFGYETTTSPPGLVMSFTDVAWLIPTGLGRRAYGMVEGFRFGVNQNGVSRLTFDVDRPFAITRVFELPPKDSNGHRLLIDIVPLPVGMPMRVQRLTREAQPALRTPQARPPLERTRTPTRAAPPTLERQRAALDVPLPMFKPRAEARKRVVVIDPGHGGVDPGAIGGGKVYEKDVVLKAALVLRERLEATGRYEAVLTRSDDTFLRLRDRLNVARDSGGEVFLSLHADNLVNNPGVSGAAVYTLSDKASSDEAARLAGEENRADILGGIDLSEHESIVSQILIDLAQRDANTRSLRIADILLEELSNVTEMLRGARQEAGFVVLKSPDMPSVLIELGYLSNRDDQRRLVDADHLSELAEAVVSALDRFFGFAPS